MIQFEVLYFSWWKSLGTYVRVDIQPGPFEYKVLPTQPRSSVARHTFWSSNGSQL